MILNSKRLKELQSENEELKNLIEGFKGKEERLKRFEELIKKARLEYADIALKKDQTAQKLEALESDKARLNNELHKISNEIKQLRNIKLSEHNQLLALENVLSNSNIKSIKNNQGDLSSTKQIIIKEIETAEKRKNEISSETLRLKKVFEELNNKIVELNKVKVSLTNEIEKKKEEISSFIERQKSVPIIQTENFNSTLSKENEEKLKRSEELQARINKLCDQESAILDRLTLSRRELEDLDKQIEEKRLQITNQADIKESLAQLAHTESLKQDLIYELDLKINAQEAQLTSLIEECKSKTESLEILHRENERLLEEFHLKNEELKRLNESIEISTVRLTDLDFSLNILDEEFIALNNEVENKRIAKAQIESEINDKISAKIEIEDVLKELRETTSILAQLKKDIEKGSGHSAKRFTDVLQYYSTMIKEMYIKKTELEKVLNQKEKDIFDKDCIIEEKQAAINEMGNGLYVRQHRLELLKELTLTITKQREYIESSSNNSVQQENLTLSKHLTHEKLLEFEDALKELLSNSDIYSADLISDRVSLEKNVAESKRRLNELNESIRSSTNELSDLRNSIDKIKIEHEEHRLAINKLAAMKKKLEDEINKHQAVFDKYFKIKEMIRQEQEIIKMKRDLAHSIKSSNKSDGAKSFEPHTPNWIKF